MNTRSVVGLLVFGLVLPDTFFACQTTFSCEELQNCNVGGTVQSGAGGASSAGTSNTTGTNTGGTSGALSSGGSGMATGGTYSTGGVGTPATGTGGNATGGVPASGAGGIATGGAGIGGAATSGDTTGGAGIGGTFATGGMATGGAGTGGFVSACGSLCTDTKPICNESAKTCVECLNNGNCPPSRPACNPATDTCVGCMLDSYCPASTPACNMATYTCVQCLSNSNCSSPTPACNTATNACVQCTGNANCGGATPACNTATNTCVQCTSNSNCGGLTPLCDTTKNTCVECLSSSDCKSAAASLCSSGTCSPCAADADCSHIAGKTVCKTSSMSDGDAGAEPGDAGATPNECVQCTGTDYAACGQSAGKALVCDSNANTCSTTATAQSAGLCQPCISDAECTPGKRCYLETFNGSSVEYFCFWKQGDTTNGAPTDCPTAGRPYVKSEKDVTSIDGDTATLCTLRSTTCTAYNQFSNIDCAPSGTPQDALCGFAPGADSKCATYGAGYRCTTVCASNDDCKFSCNIGASPNICTFQ